MMRHIDYQVVCLATTQRPNLGVAMHDYEHAEWELQLM